MDRSEKSEKLPATIGNYIAATEAVSRVRPRTFGNYCRSLRMIASEIADIEATKSRYSAKGAKKWRSKIDELHVSELTPARIAAWQKKRLDEFADDPLKQRSAKTTANTHVRQAKSLFGKRVLPLVSEQIDIQDHIPFSEVELFPQQSLRYQSALDPEVVLAEAVKSLKEEPLKILTLALCAGLRAGEIDGLRWSQVNLKNGEIRIEVTETFEAKSEDSLGTVDLDDGFVGLLRGWKAKATGPFVVDPGNEKPPNWPGSFRAHEQFQELYKWLRELEIDGKTPLKEVNKPLHTLRKEAGSLVNQRHGLAAASMFLRHADIGITARYYVAKKERLTTGLMIQPENVTPINEESKTDAGETSTKRTS